MANPRHYALVSKFVTTFVAKKTNAKVAPSTSPGLTMRALPLLLVSIPLLLSCTLQPEPTQPISNPPMTDLPALPDHIQTQVRTNLANHLTIPINQITLQNHSRQTWSDGCLGLGGPAESCLAALTEGWQVEAIDNATNKTYIYRTNLNGDHIRREP